VTAAGVVHRAGLLSLVGLMYASACGGPYGMEDFVPKVGPGLFLLLLVVTPVFWGLPTALATAELSSRRPVAGGYYRWASEFLGPFWGYQEGVWNVLSSFLDNALYPVLFARAVSHMAGGLPPLEEWLVAVGFIAVLTWLNYRGIEIAGATAIGLNLFLIAPLVWLVAAAFTQARHSPFVPFSSGGADMTAQIGATLALSMWLYSGYYEVSAAAEEIDAPARNIPLALLILSPLVVASYALPTMAGLVAVGGWETWTSGEFTSMGRSLAGPALGYWLFLGSAASQAVIFLSYLLWWSRLVQAMAADGHLPAFLSARHPRHGTPHRILIGYGLIYSAMAALPFEDLLVADVWLAGASNLILQASLVRSRRGSEPTRGLKRRTRERPPEEEPDDPSEPDGLGLRRHVLHHERRGRSGADPARRSGLRPEREVPALRGPLRAGERGGAGAAALPPRRRPPLVLGADAARGGRVPGRAAQAGEDARQDELLHLGRGA
jgi:polyamine:H+ symporter